MEYSCYKENAKHRFLNSLFGNWGEISYLWHCSNHRWKQPEVKWKKSCQWGCYLWHWKYPLTSTVNFNDICVLWLSSHTCEQNTLPWEVWNQQVLHQPQNIGSFYTFRLDRRVSEKPARSSLLKLIQVSMATAGFWEHGTPSVVRGQKGSYDIYTKVYVVSNTLFLRLPPPTPTTNPTF